MQANTGQHDRLTEKLAQPTTWAVSRRSGALLVQFEIEAVRLLRPPAPKGSVGRYRPTGAHERRGQGVLPQST